MKGVILAGGTGSRLWPITKAINKHLLPVYNHPMVYYPLKTLIDGGLKDILIVTNPQDVPSFEEIFGNGSEFKINIQYIVQNKPTGIADAVSLAEQFAQDQIVCILGDNILMNLNLKKAINEFKKQKGAKVFLKKVKDPRPYGIAKIANGQIKNIIEKPKKTNSNLAVIGLYMYDQQIFEIIKTKVAPSHRNEMEITSVNNYYIKSGQMSYEIIKNPWIDAGESFESLFKANEMARKSRKITNL